MSKSHGTDLSDARVESPEQVGRAERHGGLCKSIFKKVVHNQNVTGLGEVIYIASEVDSTKNVSEPTPDPANPLLDATRMARASRPGMYLLARREAPYAVEPHESPVGLFNERT
eukprot:3389285-Pyramimonas_sp.AAC.1